MHKKQITVQEWICMKCTQTSHVEGDQFLHWCPFQTCISLLRKCQSHRFLNSKTETSQMNTFPVLHTFIVNVKLSKGWIDLEWETLYLLACRNFFKQSSSANGTNDLFLWICHLSLTSLKEWNFMTDFLNFPNSERN